MIFERIWRASDTTALQRRLDELYLKYEQAEGGRAFRLALRSSRNRRGFIAPLRSWLNA